MFALVISLSFVTLITSMFSNRFCFFVLTLTFLGFVGCKLTEPFQEDSGEIAALGSIRSDASDESADEKPMPAPTEFSDPGGDLGLRQLTELAIANSPEITAADTVTKVSRARRAIVGQWRDPELRTSFDWDDLRVNEVKEDGNNDNIRRAESFAFSLRFYPPNPWEIRAEMHKAMAEINYADFIYKQASRDVINEVRGLYQELQFLTERARLGEGVYRLEQEEYQRLSELMKEGGLRGPVDKARLRALKTQTGEVTSDQIRIRKVRSQLAALVGINDGSRIKVEGVPDRPMIGFGPGSEASLSEMAFLNDLTLNDLTRLQRVSKSELSAYEARKIPWLSFLSLGRDRTFRDHLAVSDSWEIGLSFNIPLFTTFSKEATIHEEQIKGYQKQVARSRRQIERQIASAVANIRATRQDLGRFDGESRDIDQSFQKMEADMAMVDLPFEKAEVLHERRSMNLSRSRDRLTAEESYHDAILDLEVLIRADVESVFVSKNPAMAEKKPAQE